MRPNRGRKSCSIESHTTEQLDEHPEKDQEIHFEFEQLDENDQVMVRMLLEGYSQVEIAEALGWSPQKVTRSKAALKKYEVIRELVE